MKRKSIFKKDSQKIDAAFIEAGHPEKILLVPLDFAKATHYACFCDGLGRYQRQAFTVKNNSEGLDYLVGLIEAARKSRSIRNKQHVIVGGEDSASYTRNFMQRLKELGYLAVRLSSCEVHRQAESMDSSTDKTALRAIAKTMLNRDAQLIDGHDIYTELRALTRQRRRIVHLNTAVKNRIHTHADRLFPGFLSKGSALSPFSKGSLELMSKPSFSAASISGKNEKILARQLARQGTARSAEVAIALKQQAKKAIFADKNSAHMSAHILSGELELFRALQSNLEELKHDAVHRKLGGRAVDTAMGRRFLRIARALCKTHYIYLPSSLRGQNVPPSARGQYILDSWPDLLVKWKRLGMHEEAFAPEHPLGQWRLLMQEIYDIELSL